MLTQERFRFMPMDGDVFFKHYHDHSSQIVWTTFLGGDWCEVTAILGKASATVFISTSNPEELDQAWSTLLETQRRLLSEAKPMIYADGSVTWW
jgi:hypothetical protein